MRKICPYEETVVNISGIVKFVSLYLVVEFVDFPEGKSPT